MPKWHKNYLPQGKEKDSYLYQGRINFLKLNTDLFSSPRETVIEKTELCFSSKKGNHYLDKCHVNTRSVNMKLELSRKKGRLL